MVTLAVSQLADLVLKRQRIGTADYELSQEPSESTQEDPSAPEINDLDDP